MENIKQKWIEALRSGKYTQARNQLQDELGGNCCLGVLLKVADMGHLIDQHINIREENDNPENDPLHDESLSYDLCREIGADFLLNSAVGGNELEIQHLMHMNDTDMLDFNQIASYIEEHIK
jgi:hypothetical protein